MSGKPPLPPKPKQPQRPTAGPARPAAAGAGAAAPVKKPPVSHPPPTHAVSTLKPPPPHVVSTLKPPQVIPLKPPPAHLYRQQQHPGAGPPRKPRCRQPQRRRACGGCSCRRVCCLATGLVLLALCLALAASCLAYLYYRPRAPTFHLRPLRPVRLRLGNNATSSSSPAAVSAVDATVGVRAVSWNPNERIAFRYGAGEGRVALSDADGDVDLGWAPVAGFEHAPRSVAAVGFVASARGVVLDDAVAARVRDRYRRRQLAFNVVVDARVGVRVGSLRSGMVPVRLVCDGGVMAPPRGGDSTDDAGGMGPMSKCQVYLFRVRWFSLN